MADADLIARVYPYCDLNYHAHTAIERSPWSMGAIHPRQDPRVAHASQTARELTAPPDQDDLTLDQLPYLELRFSRTPRTSVGLVFGTDPNLCDVVLPPTTGISRRHFALTYKNDFDDRCYRLIVRDLGSTYKTTVTYNGVGGSKQRKFDWILHGFELPDNTDELVIELYKDVKFQIVVNPHDITSSTYIDNVQRFRRGAAVAENLFGALGLQSGPETKYHSQVQSPTTVRIIIPQGFIGNGTFGTVSRCWDVSTGKELACKEPVPGPYDLKSWRKEIDIMKSITHEHIVGLYCWNENPPRMYMEYMRFGNLENQHEKAFFLQEECSVILYQTILALDYLHGLREPVAHRDIKPENILVQYRDPDRNPDRLHVKLSDFGLAKTGNLKTNCGTPTYQPPEVQDGQSWRKYTKAVDIWSLGVVILRLSYGLPFPGAGYGRQWCSMIVQKAKRQDSERLANILRLMLVMEPNLRVSASACLRWASNLRGWPYNHSAMTQASAPYTTVYGTAMQHTLPQYNPIYGVNQPQPIEGEYLNRLTGAYGGNRGAYGPPPEPAEEYPIVRPVQHSPDGFIFVYIRRQRVSMRASDYYLNVSEMMAAASLSKSTREKHLKKLRKCTKVLEQNGYFWVPFGDGALFSCELGLQEGMKELLAYGPKPPQHKKAGKRRILEWNGFKIGYVPSTRKVNATHLLKMRGMDGQKLIQYLKKHPQIEAEIIRGRDKGCDRGYATQGTYIAFNDALEFCDAFHLSREPVHQLLTMAMVESGDAGPATGHEHASHNTQLAYNNTVRPEIGAGGNQSAGTPGAVPPSDPPNSYFEDIYD